jgi:hypothetical protein
MRRLGSIGVGLTLAVSLAAACGDNSKDAVDVGAVRPTGFEATPEYLASALNDLESVPHRFEMTMQMGFEIDGDMRGLDPARIIGEFDGERQYARLEGSGLFGQSGRGTVEQIVDIPGQALYVRSPDADDALDEMPEQLVPDFVQTLAVLGDKWGRADLSELADVLPDDW